MLNNNMKKSKTKTTQVKKIQHNGWFYFANVSLNANQRPPWLWQFNVEYDFKKGKYVKE